MKSKNLRLVLPLFVILPIVLAVSASAVTIQVPADQPTIQQAINAANNGDLILVSPGTYFEHIDYQGKAITIKSVVGPSQTTIDGSNNGTVVKFQTHETLQSVLTGFTIQHGRGSSGGGIYILTASPTITQNIFRDNFHFVGGFGSAIAGNVSSPVIEQNAFFANACDNDTQLGAGVVCFINSSSPLVINNVFRGNACCAINMGANQPVVANNTIAQNSVGVLVSGGSTSQLYANNIIIQNNVGLFVDFGGFIWTNNLVFGNTMNYSGIGDQTGLNGNISTDPMFLPTRSRRDFELQVGSPAIDAGTLSVPNLPPIDIVGNPRVVDGDGNGSVLPDIGAYEFIPPHLGVEDQLDLIGTTDEVTSEPTFASESSWHRR